MKTTALDAFRKEKEIWDSTTGSIPERKAQFAAVTGRDPKIVGDRIVWTESDDTAYLRRVYDYACSFAERRGFKKGWVAHTWKSTFGVWPDDDIHLKLESWAR